MRSIAPITELIPVRMAHRSPSSPTARALLLIAAWAACGYSPLAARPHPTAEGIILSEIGVWPLEGECPWVKLINDSDASADIRGWSLADGMGPLVVFLADLPSLPSGGVVLVELQPGAESMHGQLVMIPGPGIRMRCSVPAVRPVFMPVGECALYSSLEPGQRQIIDYAYWETTPSYANYQAATQTWPAASFDAPLMGLGGPGVFRPIHGGSLGRGPRLDAATWPALVPPLLESVRLWHMYDSLSASPGQINKWPAPVLWGRPSRDGVSCALDPNLERVRALANAREHFQTSLGAAFDTILFHGWGDRRCSIDPPLPPGEYYVRVRTEGGLLVTPWSGVVRFQVIEH